MEIIKGHPQLPGKIIGVTDFLYTPDNISRIQNAIKGKKVIVFDFDGVCHDESQYQAEAKKIVPFEGVIKSVRSLKNDGFTLILWSTRIYGFSEEESGHLFIENFLRNYHLHNCFDFVITGENMGIKNSQFSNTQINITTLQIDNILEKNRTFIDITQKNLDLLFPQGAVLIDNNVTFSLGKWIPETSGKYQIIIAGSGIKTYFNPDPDCSRFQQNIDYLHSFSDPTEAILKNAILDRFRFVEEYLSGEKPSI